MFFNFYGLSLAECTELDEKIAYRQAQDTSELGNSRIDELIKSPRGAKGHETAAAAFLTEALSAGGKRLLCQQLGGHGSCRSNTKLD